MKQFYVFKDGRMQGSAATRELAIDLIRQYQKLETHPFLRSEFSMIEGGRRIYPLPLPAENVPEKERDGAIGGLP